MFELTRDTVGPWLVERGLAAAGDPVSVDELPGGVSASVLVARTPSRAVVVKQALPRLRVQDEWLAKQERAETEAAAMRLCGALTPGAVPAVVDSDAERHVVAIELVEGRANWQAEVETGAVHAEFGAWAGTVLGTWHRSTAGDADVAVSFDDHEAFAQLRLDPFHATVIARRPELAARISPRLEELRVARRCLVHGDYAMKNMLVGPSGATVLDFEVAHYGHPVFDLAFFLSFVVLSAVHWPANRTELERLAAGFMTAYERETGPRFAGDASDVVAHTACLVLARTDGKSIALFLDEPSRTRAREVGVGLLERPEQGLWAWA